MRKSGKSIFDKELDKQDGDLSYPFRNVKEILYEPVPFSHKADLRSKVVCERIKKRGVLLMVDQVHPGFARSEYVIRATIAFWN